MTRIIGLWSAEEDALLQSLLGPGAPLPLPSWIDLERKHFSGTRNTNQLRHRWCDVLKNGGRKRRRNATADTKAPGPTTRNGRTTTATSFRGAPTRPRKTPQASLALPAPAPTPLPLPPQAQRRSVGRPRLRFTPEEDDLLRQLKAAGMTFEEMEQFYFPSMQAGAAKSRWQRLHRSSLPVGPTGRKPAPTTKTTTTPFSLTSTSRDPPTTRSLIDGRRAPIDYQEPETSDEEGEEELEDESAKQERELEAGRALVMIRMSRMTTEWGDRGLHRAESFSRQPVLATDEYDAAPGQTDPTTTPSTHSTCPLTLLASVAPSPTRSTRAAQSQASPSFLSRSPTKRRQEPPSSQSDGSVPFNLTCSHQALAKTLFHVTPSSEPVFSSTIVPDGNKATSSAYAYFSEGEEMAEEVKNPRQLLWRSPPLSPVQAGASRSSFFDVTMGLGYRDRYQWS